MHLTNAAHEHFTTQTGKKSKTALKNFMGPGSRAAEGRGLTYGAEGRVPSAEKNKYPSLNDSLVFKKSCPSGGILQIYKI